MKDIIKTINRVINKLEMAQKADIFEQSMRDRMIKESIVDLDFVIEDLKK